MRVTGCASVVTLQLPICNLLNAERKVVSISISFHVAIWPFISKILFHSNLLAAKAGDRSAGRPLDPVQSNEPLSLPIIASSQTRSQCYPLTGRQKFKEHGVSCPSNSVGLVLWLLDKRSAYIYLLKPPTSPRPITHWFSLFLVLRTVSNERLAVPTSSTQDQFCLLVISIF